MREGGSIKIFRRKFLSRSAEKLRMESYSTSIFSGIEKIYASERWEAVSRFSVELFLPHGAEKFRRGESFSVSLIPGIEKFYASESYVTFSDFLSNFFLSHIAEKNPR